MEQLEHRVIKLELRVDNHADDLRKLSDISDSLKKSLVSIEKTLAQIKWIALGAIIATLGQAMGLDKVIKIFL
jgi:uncharacterized coiled-coil protein SlyX